MVNGLLTIRIGGREALPVRAIPYVTQSPRFSTDMLSKRLAECSPLGRKSILWAYCLSGSKPVRVLTREWKVVVARHDEFADYHRRHFPNSYMNWACPDNRTVALLLAGTFVWWDEFVEEFRADREGLLFSDDGSDDALLITTPTLDACTRAMVMEGFDAYIDVPFPDVEPLSAMPIQQPAHEKRDITRERGCRRLIRENWGTIRSLHGNDADGRQVLRVLKQNMEKNEQVPKLKTIQNHLIVLRKEKLIP